MESKDSILLPQVQQFIEDHKLEDPHDLLLKHREIEGVPISRVVNQISGLRKAKEKLPRWYETKGIVFPPAVNLEQSSSELTAQVKTEILSAESFPKEQAVDLTGGFGVDAFFLSQQFRAVEYVETDETLLAIARHNHGQLGSSTIRYHATDSKSFISTCTQVDLVYADPSRRAKGNKKVFHLSDCQPNIVELLPEIFSCTSYLLLKVSPLLDIQQGLRELKYVKKIFVVAIDNDCKELLFLCSKGFEQEAEITAIHLNRGHADRFSFRLSEERTTKSEVKDPLDYLYEPNASILKAGAFNLVARRYGLKKIQANTHFYTADKLESNFPGRIFKVLAHVKSDPRSVVPHFPEGKGNIIVRNYPLSPDELRKKVKLKDGGDRYLLAFRGTQSKFLIAASRIK